MAMMLPTRQNSVVARQASARPNGTANQLSPMAQMAAKGVQAQVPQNAQQAAPTGRIGAPAAPPMQAQVPAQAMGAPVGALPAQTPPMSSSMQAAQSRLGMPQGVQAPPAAQMGAARAQLAQPGLQARTQAPGQGPGGAQINPAVQGGASPTGGQQQGGGDPHIEQLYNDMLNLNEQARGDIEKQGQEKFGAMQRAAMAASSRYGGGVGGAVMSTQGDMLRQATAGMADALAANTGQRQQIMGNYMSGLWGDQRMNQRHTWDQQAAEAGAQGDINSQDLATAIKGAQNAAASAMRQQGSGDPLQGLVNNPHMQELFDAIGAAKSPEDARKALNDLNSALSQNQGDFESSVQAAAAKGTFLNEGEFNLAKQRGWVKDKDYKSYKKRYGQH